MTKRVYNDQSLETFVPEHVDPETGACDECDALPGAAVCWPCYRSGAEWRVETSEEGR